MSSPDHASAPSPPPPTASPAAYLLLEEGRAVRRIRLTNDVTRLGLAPDGSVTLDPPGVRHEHARIERRGRDFLLTPGPRVEVRLNDRALAGPAPLRSGHRIGLGRATLVFAPISWDNRSRHKTYVVVGRADGFVINSALQHTLIWVGRTHGDLLVMDDGLAGRHFLIEAYGPDAVFVSNERESAPIILYDEPVVGLRRVFNGGTVRAGGTDFAVFGRPRGAVERPPWRTAARPAVPRKELRIPRREAPATLPAPDDAGAREQETVLLDGPDAGAPQTLRVSFSSGPDGETILLNVPAAGPGQEDETVLLDPAAEASAASTASPPRSPGGGVTRELPDASSLPVAAPDDGGDDRPTGQEGVRPASPYLHDEERPAAERNGEKAGDGRYLPGGRGDPSGLTQELGSRLGSAPTRKEERYLPKGRPTERE